MVLRVTKMIIQFLPADLRYRLCSKQTVRIKPSIRWITLSMTAEKSHITHRCKDDDQGCNGGKEHNFQFVFSSLMIASSSRRDCDEVGQKEYLIYEGIGFKKYPIVQNAFFIHWYSTPSPKWRSINVLPNLEWCLPLSPQRSDPRIRTFRFGIPQYPLRCHRNIRCGRPQKPVTAAVLAGGWTCFQLSYPASNRKWTSFCRLKKQSLPEKKLWVASNPRWQFFGVGTLCKYNLK